MIRELDPAYFEPHQWEKNSADNPLEECYIHVESKREISPEKYYQLYHEANVIDRADVTRNDRIRDLVDMDDVPWNGDDVF